MIIFAIDSQQLITMKKILLSFAAMFFSAASVNADDFVTVASGTQTTQFAVNDIEKIKFGEDIITFVEKSGKETPFEYDVINEITFDYIATGLDAVPVPDALPIDAERAEVYSLSGHRMNGDKLPCGVYIIKNGTKVTKLIKR